MEQLNIMGKQISTNTINIFSAFKVTYKDVSIRIEAINDIEAKKKGLIYFCDLEHGKRSIRPWNIEVEELIEKEDM